MVHLFFLTLSLKWIYFIAEFYLVIWHVAAEISLDLLFQIKHIPVSYTHLDVYKRQAELVNTHLVNDAPRPLCTAFILSLIHILRTER